MPKHKTHLTHWNSCNMTKRQGAMLVAHLDRDCLRHNVARSTRTAKSLVDRAWLRVNFDGSTSLTERGRLAALKAATVLGDAPSIVPHETFEKERV